MRCAEGVRQTRKRSSGVGREELRIYQKGRQRTLEGAAAVVLAAAPPPPQQPPHPAHHLPSWARLHSPDGDRGAVLPIIVVYFRIRVDLLRGLFPDLDGRVAEGRLLPQGALLWWFEKSPPPPILKLPYRPKPPCTSPVSAPTTPNRFWKFLLLRLLLLLSLSALKLLSFFGKKVPGCEGRERGLSNLSGCEGGGRKGRKGGGGDATYRTRHKDVPKRCRRC